MGKLLLKLILLIISITILNGCDIDMRKLKANIVDTYKSGFIEGMNCMETETKEDCLEALVRLEKLKDDYLYGRKK